MKKLTASIFAILAIALLAPVAQAGHSIRRAVGYNQCGDTIYATWRIVSYQRCGTPNYAWVRDRSSGCSRPGRCHHHGYSRTYTRSHTNCRSGNSRGQFGFVTPRISIRTQPIGRSANYRSNSYRSSYSRSRSCR